MGDGRQKIEWARAHMPIISEIKRNFRDKRPFAGLTIGVCLHVTAKAAVWVDALVTGGAKVVITGSPGTTQDDVAQEINHWDGVRAIGQRHETYDDHIDNCREVLRAKPNLLVDNGADLHSLIFEDVEFEVLKGSLIGATEETTSGGYRLHESGMKFEFATFIINDTEAKRIVENRFGVGSSVVEGIMRATNLMLHGKSAVVLGYGYCGSGIAQRLRGMGAHVTVVDPNPMRALEAHLEGFKVAEKEPALASANLVITVTGRSTALSLQDLLKLRDKTLIANAGHFANEIEINALKELSQKREVFRDQIVGYDLDNGKTVYVIADANMVNLASGDGNPIEVMDLGTALQCLSLERLAKEGRTVPAGPSGVPKDIEERVAKIALKVWSHSNTASQ